MVEKNTVSLQSVIRFSLPLGATLLVGDPASTINWAVNVRAQPPAFPEIYGGELALISMEVLRGFNARLTLSSIIEDMAKYGISAIAVNESDAHTAIDAANDHQIALIALPPESSLTSIERAVNTLILNEAAQLTERSLEIQRRLARLVAENRNLESLLHVVAQALAKPVVVHDEVGVIQTHVASVVGRQTRSTINHSDFQKWLDSNAPRNPGNVVASPIGFTIIIQVEKKTAGYLSLVDPNNELEEFDRLVLSHAADACAIEIAKHRAVAFCGRASTRRLGADVAEWYIC